MGNMSYCRFQNTLEDLRECLDFIDDKNLSEEENKARIKLIKLCKYIAKEYEDIDDLDEEFENNKEFDEDDECPECNLPENECECKGGKK